MRLRCLPLLGFELLQLNDNVLDGRVFAMRFLTKSLACEIRGSLSFMTLQHLKHLSFSGVIEVFLQSLNTLNILISDEYKRVFPWIIAVY